MFKNTAAKLTVYVWDTTTGLPKTGDAANLTAYVSKDDGTLTVLADTSATEVDSTNGKGYYLFDLAQGETNADKLHFTCKSSTANMACLAVPAVVYTIPATGILAPTVAGRTLDVSTGGEAGVDWANVGSPTTSLALTGTTIATTQKVDVETIKTQTVTCAAGVTVSPYVGATGAAINGTNANTLSSHDPGATIGTSTLTQTQVTGGAYALNSSSFAFNAAMDFTTTQKAATLARVTLTDTVTTYTGNTPQTGDAYAIVNSGTHGNAAIKGYVDDIGTAGAGLTAVPWNAAWDAEVQSEVDDALAATVYLRKNTLQSGTTASVVLDASASAVNDYYKLCKIAITSGTGAGQVQIITAYNGTTKTATVAPSFATAPDNTSVFVILPGTYEWSEYLGDTGTTALIEDLWQHTDRTITGFSAAGSIAIRTAVGLASANLDTQLGDLPTNAELATSQASADDATLAAIAALNNLSAAQVNAEADTALSDVGLTTTVTGRIDRAISAIMTTAMTESYSADGAAPTPAQALFLVLQRLTEFAVSGTTITVKKLDGSTTAFTLTLDDATTPTSSTRAT